MVCDKVRKGGKSIKKVSAYFWNMEALTNQTRARWRKERPGEPYLRTAPIVTQ